MTPNWLSPDLLARLRLGDPWLCIVVHNKTSHTKNSHNDEKAAIAEAQGCKPMHHTYEGTLCCRVLVEIPGDYVSAVNQLDPVERNLIYHLRLLWADQWIEVP